MIDGKRTWRRTLDYIANECLWTRHKRQLCHLSRQWSSSNLNWLESRYGLRWSNLNCFWKNKTLAGAMSTGSYLYLHFENLLEELCTPQVRTVDTFWPPQLSSTKSPSHQQGTHTIHAITSLLLDSPHLQVAAHGNSDANVTSMQWLVHTGSATWTTWKKKLQNLVGRCSKMLMFGSGSNSTRRRRPTSVTMIGPCLYDYCFCDPDNRASKSSAKKGFRSLAWAFNNTAVLPKTYRNVVERNPFQHIDGHLSLLLRHR